MISFVSDDIGTKFKVIRLNYDKKTIVIKTDLDLISINSERRISEKKNSEKNIHKVKIESSKCVEPECFNDYLAQLEEPIKKVIKLELESYKLPENKYEFTYVGENEKRTIILAPEKDINDLINELQNAFNMCEDKLQINLVNERVIIKSDNEFDIIVNDRALFEVLGFTKLSYFNKKLYRADKKFNIDLMNKIYMYVENVVENKPFAILDLINFSIDYQNNEMLEIPIDELKDLHIKFKTKKTLSDEYLYDFKDESHELNFNIATL
jgi:hypothetical protein